MFTGVITIMFEIFAKLAKNIDADLVALNQRLLLVNKPVHGGYPDLGDEPYTGVKKLFSERDFVTVVSDGPWNRKSGRVTKVISCQNEHWGWKYKVQMFGSNQEFTFMQTELTFKS